MGYSIKNGARRLQEVPEKSLISGKRKRKLLFEIEKKGKQKIKMFSKIARVDEPDLSIQSEQAEPEQRKQKNCIYQETDDQERFI